MREIRTVSKKGLFNKNGLSKLSKQKNALPERNKGGNIVLSKNLPPTSQAAGITFFLIIPSLNIEFSRRHNHLRQSGETLIILNLLLLLNISEQKYHSCSLNNDNNNFNVLMGCRRRAESLGPVDWELSRTSKHESSYDKYQAHPHNVVDLDPIIEEMRVLVKYTKEEGRFTVAKKKVH